jgi:thioredoxin reductase (NADPH)
VLPDFTNRVKEGYIVAKWDSRVKAIESNEVVLATARGEERIRADRVYVMTGFAPKLDLLVQAGVPIDPITGIPSHNSETLETSVPGVFIAGVVVAGYDANKVFIENGRYHGDRIVARLLGQRAPAEPKLSAELDA